MRETLGGGKVYSAMTPQQHQARGGIENKRSTDVVFLQTEPPHLREHSI